MLTSVKELISFLERKVSAIARVSKVQVFMDCRCLDGNKHSQNTSAFHTPAKGHQHNKDKLQDSIRTMKDSHFSIGMTKENHLNPAPYKVSNPEGGMRP